MVVWIIIGVLALLACAVCMVPVGFDAQYLNKQLTLSAKACGIKVKVFPRDKIVNKKEANPPPKPEKATNKDRKKKKNKKGKTLDLVMSNEELFSLFKKLPEGIGKITGGFRVDRFLLHYLAAGKDPYDTAVVFSYVNASLSSLAPICAQRFPCKDVDVSTDIDFTREKMEIDFALAMSLKIGSVFAMVNTILFGALGILIRNKARILWCRRFNRKAYEEILLDESAATKLLKQLLLKKQEKEERSESDVPENSASAEYEQTLELSESDKESRKGEK